METFHPKNQDLFPPKWLTLTYLSQEGYSIFSYPRLDGTDMKHGFGNPMRAASKCLHLHTHSLSAICMSVHMAECVCSWVCDSCSAWLSVCVWLSVYLSSLSDTSPKQCFDLAMDVDAASTPVNAGAGWISSAGRRCCPLLLMMSVVVNPYYVHLCLVCLLISTALSVQLSFVLFLSSGIYFDLIFSSFFLG